MTTDASQRMSNCDYLLLERLRNKAKTSIGEKDDLIQTRLEELKAIVSKDEKITLHPPIYDEFFLRCIRARKYDLERAAKLYKKFCMLRYGNTSDLLCKLVPSSYNKLYQKKLCSILVSRDMKGRHVFIVRIDKWDTKETTFEDFMACLFLLLDEIVASIDTQLNGIVVIGDLKGLGISHARLIRPGKLQAFVSVLQDSYPARFKEFHAFNNPYVFNMIFAVCKPFFKEKMRKRIYFHGYDCTNLHKGLSIDPDVLPEFLGGKVTEDEYADDSIVESLLQKDDYYHEFLKYGYPPL